MEEVRRWAAGEPRREGCVGLAADNPNHYKVFKYRRDRAGAGYQPVPGTALVFGAWSEYVKLFPNPDDPDEIWYGFLDEVDEKSRQRRQRGAPDDPAGKSRDDVAAWVAKKHLFVDSAIREIWYLPRGAPPDEIRFLELNERLAATGDKAEAID